MSSLHIAGISGSLRKGSLNTALLTTVQSLLPSDVTFERIEIGTLPLFNSDLEADGPVPVLTDFRERLMRANALVIASPEYNFSIPGVLKNALDWASRGKDSPLQNKPVAIMGASPGMLGTSRMQMHLRQVFLFNNMQTVVKPEVFIAQAPSKFDANGNLIDQKTIETIGTLLAQLISSAIRNQHPL